MKQNWIHKIITIVFITIILFPIIVQASHALEKHEHSICTAKNEKHYHQDEVDCVICKFQSTSKTFHFINEVTLQDANITLELPKNIYIFKYSSTTLYKPSRAPPTLV